MQARTKWYVTVLVAAGIALPLSTARAGDSYSSSIVPETAGNTSDITLTKANLPCAPLPGSPTPPKPCGNSIKVVPAPASKPGQGMAMTLTLNGVDCPTEGNDKSKPGKCGAVQTTGNYSFPNSLCTALKKPKPCCTGAGIGTCVPVNGVLDMSVHVLGSDFPDVAGIPIYFAAGKGLLTVNGKNKIDGSVFGGLIGAILGQPLGFAVTTVRTEGTVPSDCATVPLLPGNHCLDGSPIAFTGITLGP